jgi:hypothetical protein
MFGVQTFFLCRKLVNLASLANDCNISKNSFSYVEHLFACIQLRRNLRTPSVKLWFPQSSTLECLHSRPVECNLLSSDCQLLRDLHTPIPTRFDLAKYQLLQPIHERTSVMQWNSENNSNSHKLFARGFGPGCWLNTLSNRGLRMASLARLH